MHVGIQNRFAALTTKSHGVVMNYKVCVSVAFDAARLTAR